VSFLAVHNGNRQILGTTGCLMIVGGIVSWIALTVWLSDRLGWPDAYGYPCHLARGCWLQGLWDSSALLSHGGTLSYVLFVVLWLPQTAIITGYIYSFLQKRRRSNGTPSSSSSE
jgi:hypothetical protein